MPYFTFYHPTFQLLRRADENGGQNKIRSDAKTHWKLPDSKLLWPWIILYSYDSELFIFKYRRWLLLNTQ